MSRKALGVIEVKSVGLLTQAMDVMAKTADFDFLSYEMYGSKQVAGFIRGDAAACTAAIAAGKTFVDQNAPCALVMAFVIPEPHEKLVQQYPIVRWM